MSQSEKEKRLIELAKQIDEKPEDQWPSNVNTDCQGNDSLTAEQVDELRRARRALGFLEDIRRAAQQEHPSLYDSRLPTRDESFPQGQDPTDFSEIVSFKSPKSDEQLVNQTWGRFKIIRPIGQGGFARVFLADDPKLDRQVALKIPKPAALFDEQSRVRFEREARAASLLSHPAIVPVFDVGIENGVSYIVYGYCQGMSLAEWIDDQSQIPSETAVAIVAELAEAVGHAHGRGIVHRDLKPGNVLIDRTDANSENIADRIRITDFGLAKQLDSDDHSLTYEGAVIGTPAYMSPEQARGETDIGPATDIFSLGAILYQLLAGETPFKRSTQVATLRAIENESPTDLRKLRPKLSTDLRAICMKCLNNDPQQRYTTAFELQQDLEAVQKGLPVKARPSTRIEDVWKWCRRNPVIAMALSFAFLSLAVGLSMTAWWWREANHNRSLIEVESIRAQSHFDNLEDSIKTLRNVILDAQSIPKTSPMRAGVLAEILVLQELLIAQEPDSPRAHLLVVDAYQLLARAKRALGDNQGADKAVDAAYQQLTKLKQLDEFDQFITEFELKQIEQLYEETRILSSRRDYRALKVATENALNRLSDPNSRIEPFMRSAYAISFLKLKGTAHERLNEFSEAEAAYTRCLNEFEDVHDKLTAGHFLYDRANCLNSLAILNKKKGKTDEAKQCYSQAIELAQQLVAQEPGHAEYRGLYATASFNLANLFFQNRDWPKSHQLYSQSVTEFERLVADFPENTFFHRTMISCKSALATVDGKLGNHETAAKTLSELIGTVSQWPDSYQKDLTLLISYNNLGRLKHTMLGRIADAETMFLETIQLADQALERHKYKSEFIKNRGIALANLSDVYFQSGQLDNAEKIALAAEANYLRLFETMPNDRKTQSGLGDAYGILGRISAARGNIEQAEELFSRILEHYPDSPRMMYEYSRCYAKTFSAFSSGSVNHALSEKQLAVIRDSAIQHAKTAFDQGFGDLQAMKRDNAWAGFVDHQEYLQLVSDLSDDSNN